MIVSRGYWLDFREGHGDHLFGGILKSAPPCPRCRRSVIRMMTLRTNDEPLAHLWNDAALHLLFCWRCHMFEFVYRQSGDRIEILSALPEEEWDGVSPYEGYPEAFPEWRFSLEPLPNGMDDLQVAYRAADHDDADLPPYLRLFLSTAQHQVLGSSYCHDWSPPTCPCGREMRLTATVADSAGPTGEAFVDNPSVMTVFHTCRDCCVIHARQQVD